MRRAVTLAVLLAVAALVIVGASRAEGDTPGNNQVMVFDITALPPNFTASYMAQTERAIQNQVLTEVRRYWNVPQVVFGTTGVQVWFLPQQVTNQVCEMGDVLGCHAENLGGELDIAVAQGPRFQETITLDHEILETLVDPNIATAPAMVPAGEVDAGQLEEICDPVENLFYRTPDGVWLSSFVYPGYFDGAPGRQFYWRRSTWIQSGSGARHKSSTKANQEGADAGDLNDRRGTKPARPGGSIRLRAKTAGAGQPTIKEREPIQ